MKSYRTQMDWLVCGVMLFVVGVAVAQTPKKGDRPAENESAVARLSSHEALELGKATIADLDLESDPQRVRELMDQLRQCITVVQANDTANPWFNYLRGAMLAYAKRQADAVQAFNQFVESTEGRDQWRAYRFLGDLLVDKYPSLALAKYERANLLNPNEPQVLYGLSVTYTKLGKLEKALEFAEKTVAVTPAIHPARGEFLNWYANRLAEDEQYEAALEQATLALEIARSKYADDPASRNALLTLSLRFQTLRSIAQAKVEQVGDDAVNYSRVVDLTRQAAEIQRRIVLLDALNYLNAGIENAKGAIPVSVLEQKAELLIELDRVDEAREVYREVLRLSPANEKAKAFLEK